MSNEGDLPPIAEPSAGTHDMRRTIGSPVEAMAAVGGGHQRADAGQDLESQETLARHRDEAKAPATMTPVWIRRRGPAMGEAFRNARSETGAIGHG